MKINLNMVGEVTNEEKTKFYNRWEITRMVA